MGWSEYINFLFDEDFNYRNKLSNYKIKRTKKTEKKETLETNTSNIINNNNFNNEKKNIKLYWFKWSENSCRFDCFSLALSLIYYKYIKIKNSNSKEILNVFFVMAIGLACGTGYIGFAIMFTLIVALISLLLHYI